MSSLYIFSEVSTLDKFVTTNPMVTRCLCTTSVNFSMDDAAVRPKESSSALRLSRTLTPLTKNRHHSGDKVITCDKLITGNHHYLTIEFYTSIAE